MALDLFNSLSGRIETFAAADGKTVRFYACGPTVYDYGHIGNFRTFVAVDVLRRHLRQSGFELLHVMNITDVDDKIIANAARDGVSVQQYTAKFERAFLEDSAMIGIEQPVLVRATEHIAKMADFVAKLVAKNLAYRTEDGSYYFRIAGFPQYGKLSKKDFGGMLDGARVDIDEYDKDSARDFALWKAPKPGEAFWDSPIGPGRPGWHLECSVNPRKPRPAWVLSTMQNREHCLCHTHQRPRAHRRAFLRNLFSKVCHTAENQQYESSKIRPLCGKQDSFRQVSRRTPPSSRYVPLRAPE